MSTFGSPGGRQVISKPTPYVPIHCSYTTKYTAKWHPQYAVNDTNESANAEKQRPQRGSFPLDHDGECKHIMSSYLSCLRQHRGVNENECRMLSKSYLQCRMDRNLMAPDEMKNLGYAAAQMQHTEGEGQNDTAAEQQERLKAVAEETRERKSV